MMVYVVTVETGTSHIAFEVLNLESGSLIHKPACNVT